MEANKTPEIRFKDFNAAWEQRKLGDIAHRITRKNEGESDLPLTISAQYGLVDQRTFFNNQVASKDMSGYYLLRKGEFAYNKSTSGDSPWGAVKRLEKYEKGCVSTLYICFGLDDAAPNFLVAYYETDRWYKTVQVIAAEGARNHGLLNIAPDDFFDTVLKLPSSREEQERIGALFFHLDNLITLHQRKCDKLVKIKSAMLNRMFPKPGDSEPEIRFGVFKEPWKRYKLGDVAAIARGERFTAADYVESGGIPCIHYGEIYTCYGTIATKTISQVSSSLKDSLRYAKKGDVIVAATSENVEDVCKAVVWMGNSPVAYHDDSFALTFSGDPIFLVSFFETSEFFAEKSSAAHGVKVMRVSSDSLADVDLPLPSTAEQRLIGGYFAKLDNLITLHRRKIKGLKKIKSAMLDKMSV